MTGKNDRSVLWFVIYAVGAGAVLLGLLTVVIPGVAGALLVGGGLLALVVVRGFGPSSAGAISGLSLPLFFVAWLDRRGPGGLPCHAGGSCSEDPSPWPWLVAALIFISLGVVIFLVARHTIQPPPAAPPSDVPPQPWIAPAGSQPRPPGPTTADPNRPRGPTDWAPPE
ncbi:hypothetical protein [Luteimicrobium sp. DT211]|uniref:hypothetical protein n=1 Tax=Luteimicrobium sp. DT211 TaxID=3393412 RepID=UPI003CF9FF3D